MSGPTSLHNRSSKDPTDVLAEAEQQWIYTKDELSRAPSIVDGMPEIEELTLRSKAQNFITNVGVMLKLPQTTLATATVFCNRFLMRMSLKKRADRPGYVPLHHYVRLSFERYRLQGNNSANLHYPPTANSRNIPLHRHKSGRTHAQTQGTSNRLRARRTEKARFSRRRTNPRLLAMARYNNLQRRSRPRNARLRPDDRLTLQSPLGPHARHSSPSQQEIARRRLGILERHIPDASMFVVHEQDDRRNSAVLRSESSRRWNGLAEWK